MPSLYQYLKKTKKVSKRDKTNSNIFVVEKSINSTQDSDGAEKNLILEDRGRVKFWTLRKTGEGLHSELWLRAGEGLNSEL